MDHNVLHAWIWLHKHLGFFTNSRQMFISEQSQTSEVIWEVVYFVVLQKHSCALLLHHVEFFVNRSNPSAYLTFQHIQYLLNVPPQKHQMPRPNRGNKPGHKRKKKSSSKKKKELIKWFDNFPKILTLQMHAQAVGYKRSVSKNLSWGLLWWLYPCTQQVIPPLSFTLNPAAWAARVWRLKAYPISLVPRPAKPIRHI